MKQFKTKTLIAILTIAIILLIPIAALAADPPAPVAKTSKPKPDCPTFTDASSGITMACPDGWVFMKPSEVREKTNGQLQVSSNTLVFCVNSSNPDQNINVRYTGDASSEAPSNEAAKEFLSSLEGNLTNNMQRNGFKKESSCMTEVGGGIALELFFLASRGQTAMKQRSILLISKSKGFSITCTAPQSLFNSTNSTVFDAFVSSIIVR